MWAKQSTAATLIVGPILDSAGAEYASAVIGDLSISKNGGTLTALAAAATLTHIANGQYTLVITTGNLDTLGRLQITCNKSTYQMPPVGLNIVPAMVFDSMVLGTDVLQSDVTQFGGTNGTFNSGVPTAALDSASVNAVADQVWDEAYADHNTAGSFGKLLNTIRKANLAIDGTVSNAITPTTLTFASNVAATTSAYAHAVLLFTTGPLAGENSPIISYNSTNGVFVLEEPLTAAPSNGDEFVVIAGSHVHSVADIQSGLATAAALAAAKAILDKVDTGLVVDGAVYQFTANMLELGPSGSSTVTVLPATGIVADRSAGTTLTPVVGETISQSITVYQSDGTTAVNLSAKTLKVIFETMSGVDVAVVLAADITISGASSNVVTFAYPSAVTASERTLRFAIRDAAAPLTMYLQGVCSVVAAPKVDA